MTTCASPAIRQIDTDNIEALGRFHINKNREYTQFQHGKFKANATEITLNQAQILRENFNIGTRIEATPADCFLPFAVVMPQSSDYQFCGQQAQGTPFIQASGGTWEIRSQQRLDYVATVFLREHFIKSYHLLTGREPNSKVISSRMAQTSSQLQWQYARQVLELTQQLLVQPSLLADDNIQRMVCTHLLQLTIDIVNDSLALPEPLTQHSKRQQGVTRVVEFLREHAHLLPDITQLCEVAQLSERSLQYGFKEKYGVTPVQYLRLIRLNGAHKALLNADKSTTTVAQIALNWGFVEFGRFARDYKSLFEQLPSQTLIS